MNDNTPVKVCSYRRSGTHVLMKALYDNFELPDVGKHMDTSEAQMEWYDKGDKEGIVYVPWIKLFHTHFYPREVSFDKGKVIYVFRNGIDTLGSYHRSFGIAKDFNEWITPVIIKGWYYHVLDWLYEGVYSIWFEDLINDFDSTMHGIETHFCLKRKSDDFLKTEYKIGWSPSSKDDKPRIWNESNLKTYHDIVDWDFILETSKCTH
jgi:hypothetical protein